MTSFTRCHQKCNRSSSNMAFFQGSSQRSGTKSPCRLPLTLCRTDGMLGLKRKGHFFKLSLPASSLCSPRASPRTSP